MTITFVLSVCLSVRQSVCLSVCPHVTIRLPPEIFSLNLKFDDFSKSVQNIQVRHKSDKIYEYVTWSPMYIYNNIPCIFRLLFMPASRCVGQVQKFLWRVRSLWKLGYWTAVRKLLRKQHTKKILLRKSGLAQVIKKFVFHGNSQFSYCLHELTKLRTNQQLMCIYYQRLYIIHYMCFLRTLVHTVVSRVVYFYEVFLHFVKKKNRVATFQK